MNDVAEPLAITNPPEIYVYALAGQYMGATVNRLVDLNARNIASQYRTQMIVARTMDEMNARLISVLIQQYGMTQAQAASLVPSSVIPIAPLTGSDGLYLPLTGGQMQGPILLLADPQQPLEAATRQFALAPRLGTITNDDAAPGQVGEFISASVQPASSIAAVSGATMDITSISLTPGDWDLAGHVATQVAAGGHVQNMQVWMSPTSKTPPAQLMGGLHQIGGVSTGGIEQLVLPTGRMRVPLAATTVIYLSTLITFTGTSRAAGFIGARRMR